MIPLSDSIRSRRFPFFVVSIILINIYIFYLELTAPSIERFISTWGLIPHDVTFGSPYWIVRFITSQFLHGGWLHIGSNMLFLWVFGDNIEDSLGKLRFLLFYLVCGVGAGLAQYAIDPNSTVPMIGASGAIAGVLGAYWKLYPHATVRTLIPLGFFITTAELPSSLMIGLWFLSQLFSGFAAVAESSGNIGGVAFWAHIGGFLLGIVLVSLLPPQRKNYI